MTSVAAAPDVASSPAAARPGAGGPQDVQRAVVWILTLFCSVSIAVNGFFLRETVQQLRQLQQNDVQRAIALAVLQERVDALAQPQTRSRK